MTLLVDIGNTRIKWARLHGGALSAHGEACHGGEPDAAAGSLGAIGGTAPTAVRVANVAGPDFAAAVTRACETRWGIAARFAETQRRAGRITNAYKNVGALGIDRWLAILGATARTSGPVCVVDAGTALTIDLVAADGRHLGGYILPGFELMWGALAGDTADLARLAAGQHPAAATGPGASTGAAMANGALAAVCALIERCADRLAEDNRRTVVVVTGGDAERIVPHLAVESGHRPYLVLEGLALWEAS